MKGKLTKAKKKKFDEVQFTKLVNDVHKQTVTKVQVVKECPIKTLVEKLKIRRHSEVLPDSAIPLHKI